MEVAPFFVDFHHFLSIFTIFYRFSRFTHFCRDLHFVAIYALFPQICFGQNSLLRNITRFFACMGDWGRWGCFGCILAQNNTRKKPLSRIFTHWIHLSFKLCIIKTFKTPLSDQKRTHRNLIAIPTYTQLHYPPQHWTLFLGCFSDHNSPTIEPNTHSDNTHCIYRP